MSLLATFHVRCDSWQTVARKLWTHKRYPKPRTRQGEGHRLHPATVRHELQRTWNLASKGVLEGQDADLEESLMSGFVPKTAGHL